MFVCVWREVSWSVHSVNRVANTATAPHRTDTPATMRSTSVVLGACLILLVWPSWGWAQMCHTFQSLNEPTAVSGHNTNTQTRSEQQHGERARERRGDSLPCHPSHRLFIWINPMSYVWRRPSRGQPSERMGTKRTTGGGMRLTQSINQ